MSTAATTLVRVRVLLFASYAELAGGGELELVTAAPATIADVVRQVRETAPGGERLPPRPLVALNQVHAHLGDAVADGDEIAILPPMAGG
jgi:molybdopterin converting factor small subunit